jgi:hypothetical protein
MQYMYYSDGTQCRTRVARRTPNSRQAESAGGRVTDVARTTTPRQARENHENK